MCPDPSSLTFEVEVADEDVTRAASPTDAPWPARLSSVDGKADDLQLSCRVMDGIVRPDADSVAVTRGSMVSSLSSFGVSAAVYPAASTYSAQPCGSLFFAQQVTAGTPTGWFWPGSGKEAAFYAYYPYGSSCFTLSSTAASVGVPVYSYTVPSSVASQPDIMTAQVTDVAGDTGGSVALPFRHRCAALRFSLKNEGSDAITVTSVSVSGVYGSGTLQGDTWTPGTPASTFTLAPTGGWTIAADETVDLTGTSNIFFMVPQTIPAGAKIVVVTSEDTYEAELSGTWLVGKTYGYEITKTGIKYIDLGLPSGMLWATGNICKNSSGNYYIGKDTERGCYFSYGNIDGHNEGDGSSFTQSAYAGTPGASQTSDIANDDATHNAALATLGSPWKMPRKEEFQELYDNCTKQYVSNYNGSGVNGILFTSNVYGYTDKSIFLSFNGNYYQGTLYDKNVYGRYLTSSWSSGIQCYTFIMHQNGTIYPQGIDNNFGGYSVRPVMVNPNSVNGHMSIDLGLPSGLRWATKNIGANYPWDDGMYFAWGVTTGHYLSESRNFGNTYPLGGYGPSNDLPANSTYDAAVYNMGAPWRMPTYNDCVELQQNTIGEFTSNYNGSGVAGLILTSTVEGYTDKSIFFPLTGCRYSDSPYARGTIGFYRTSTIVSNGNSYNKTVHVQDYGDGYWFNHGNADIYYAGITIRAVCP